MKIKLTALILLLSSVFCLLPANASSKEPYMVSYEAGISEFLGMLGIGDANKNEDDTVTRAEFISYVTDALNISVTSQNDGTFADVSATHPYSADIYKAKAMGIITGAGGNEFRPDDEIAYMEAVKICVMALGYMRIAEVRGGYPYGYHMVAEDIELTKGVRNNKEMKYSDTVMMLYNFLHADMCKINGVAGSDISQQRAPGKNILNHYHNLEAVEGIVKTAGYESMVPGFECTGYTMNISGRVFDTAIDNAERFLGYNVTAYYSASENEIKALYPNKKNSTMQVEAEDIYGYRENTLLVYLGDKEKEYRLDPGFSYVKNGRIIRHQNADFSLDNGRMTLIDNNGDKLYDVVYVKECAYMVISGNSITAETVFDKRTNKSIFFTNEGGNRYYLSLLDKDGSLINIKPSQLSENTVLEVYESEDGTYIEAIASKKSVTGTIDEVGEGYVVIDSVKYKLNFYFKAYFGANPGDNGTYLISANGTLTAVGVASSEIKYGFLTDFGVLEKGLDKTVKAKILDQGGSMLTVALADMVKLNGNLVKNTDPEVALALANDEYAKYQVIKYALNAEGKLFVIDTSAMPSGTLEDKYKSKINDGDDLTLNHSSRSVYIYRGYNILQPVSAVSAKTVIFTVPSCLAASNNTEGEDKRLARYDDKNYAVSPTITAATTSSGNYYVDIYDMDESMEAKAVVMYIKNVNSGASVNTDMDPAVVYKVTDALNQDGEVTKKMVVWSRNAFKTYYFSVEHLSELSKDEIPASGDIIRITTDNKGEVVGTNIDVKYNTATGKPEINTAVANKRDQAQWAYYTGKLFGMNANSISLSIEQEPPFNQAFAGEFTGYVDNMVPLSLLSSTYYAGYDTKTGSVYKMKNTDFKGASSVGVSEASYVVTYGYAGWARLVVEYGIR